MKNTDKGVHGTIEETGWEVGADYNEEWGEFLDAALKPGTKKRRRSTDLKAEHDSRRLYVSSGRNTW